MRGRIYLPWFVVIAAWLAGAMPVFAQGSAFTNVPVETPSQGSQRDALQDSDTFVSFIDNALPRTQVRLYYDDIGRIRRPTRDAYLLPNLSLPETSVDISQITSYGEVVITPGISGFLATPLMFLNADVNKDIWGMGDMNLGFKLGFLNTANLLGTFQFRAYVPTAVHTPLGTGQVSMEPSFLFNMNLMDVLTLEGEARYWFPIGGNQFNGDYVRYGLGLAYGQRDPNGIWFAPVVEGVGWSILGGKEMVPGGTAIVSSRGETIFNLNGGFRLGLGNSASFYAGYGHSLTGNYWYKDIWRLEIRFFF